jgi:hypothetical protein
MSREDQHAPVVPEREERVTEFTASVLATGGNDALRAQHPDDSRTAEQQQQMQEARRQEILQQQQWWRQQQQQVRASSGRG